MKRYFIFILVLFSVVGSIDAQTYTWKVMHQGNGAFHEKHYESAVGYYKKALEKNGSETRAMYNLANAKLAQGQDSTAVELYKRVAAKDPNAMVRSQANHNQGFVFQRQALTEKDAGNKRQMLEQAIACYKQALRDTPSLQPSRYNLALCQKQLKDLKNNSPQQKPQSQPQQNTPKPEPEKNKNNSLTNYARQAERQTRRKLNGSGRQRSLGKNW